MSINRNQNVWYQDEPLLEEQDIENQNKNKKQFCSKKNKMDIMIISILVLNIVILGVLGVVIYRVKDLDIELINRDSMMLDKILAENGTSKILEVLDSIDLNDYAIYADKIKHIIDDACYYVFRCSSDDQSPKLIDHWKIL